jgi:peroxiredoxin
MIGDPAPTVDLPTTDGGRLALETLRGNFAVVHFGTSW